MSVSTVTFTKTIVRGDTASYSVAVIDSNSLPVDLSLYTPTAIVRTSGGSLITVSDVTKSSNIVTIKMVPAETGLLSSSNTLQVEITDGVDIFTVANGTLNATGDIA